MSETKVQTEQVTPKLAAEPAVEPVLEELEPAVVEPAVEELEPAVVEPAVEPVLEELEPAVDEPAVELYPFLTFDLLKQDVDYTVATMQYLYGSTGYFYIIKVNEQDDVSDYYMLITNNSVLDNVYDKLEEMRKGNQKLKFSFVKTEIAVSQYVAAPFVVVRGVNEVVPLL